MSLGGGAFCPAHLRVICCSLAEVDLDGLLARFVRYYDLLWHIMLLFLFYVFIFINSAQPLAVWHSGRAG